MFESSHRTLWLLVLAGLLLGAALAGGLALLTPVQSANVTAVNAANALVESGHTTKAIEIYEQLIAAGARDSALYYNLGNAYYRQGDLALAVANYRQAAALAPRDQDIQANLDMALRQSPALVASEPQGATGFLSQLTSSWLSMDEAAVIVAVLWFAAMLLFLAARVLNKPRRWLNRSGIILLLLTLLLGLSLGSRALDAGTLPGSDLLRDVVALTQRL